jgi:hypothetical protein
VYRKLMGDPVKRHGIDWDSPNFTGYFYTSEEFIKEPFSFAFLNVFIFHDFLTCTILLVDYTKSLSTVPFENISTKICTYYVWHA